MKKLVVIRGGGELATGIAHRLHNTGYQVLMLEKAAPSAIRRRDSGKYVLLAEDNHINCEIVKRLLTRRGLTVETAENGQVALNKYMMNAPRTYDLILMDVRMPYMDGLKAARMIRASGKSDAKTIPIMAMTANAYDEDIKQSMEAGMNAHLVKPVEPSELYKAVQRALNGEL